MKLYLVNPCLYNGPTRQKNCMSLESTWEGHSRENSPDRIPNGIPNLCEERHDPRGYEINPSVM